MPSLRHPLAMLLPLLIDQVRTHMTASNNNLRRTAKTHVLYVNDFSKPLHEHWRTLPKGPTHPGLGSQNHVGDWLNRRDPDTTMLDAFERVPCDPRA